MTTAGLNEYISTGRRAIPGWLYATDAHLLAAAASVATDTGDLVEVGAFFGASAIELGFFLGPDERLIVIDPFLDDPDDRWAPGAGLSKAGFLANWRKFHEAEPTVLEGFSADELPKLATGSARLVHIDGSHYYDDVVADVAEARRIATPNAVLVFDDVGPWQWPGVAAAVWKAVTDGMIVPLAFTSSKLYATPSGSNLTADQVVDAALQRGMAMQGPQRVCGHDLWEAQAPPPPRSDRVRAAAEGLIPPTLRGIGRRLALRGLAARRRR